MWHDLKSHIDLIQTLCYYFDVCCELWSCDSLGISLQRFYWFCSLFELKNDTYMHYTLIKKNYHQTYVRSQDYNVILPFFAAFHVPQSIRSWMQGCSGVYMGAEGCGERNRQLSYNKEFIEAYWACFMHHWELRLFMF